MIFGTLFIICYTWAILRLLGDSVYVFNLILFFWTVNAVSYEVG